ncbi:MAG: plastocyanin/azurin family copper-binding protein [Halorientalis sp.]
MRRRAFLASVGGTAVAVSVAGCSSGSGTSGDYDIGMSTSAFRPASFAVAPGTTVVWKNTSGTAHTVTAYGSQIPDSADFFSTGDFDSTQAARDAWLKRAGGRLDSGESYEHTFTVPGTYEYFCIPHEKTGMVGVIEVTESATRTPEGGRVTGTRSGTDTE